MQNIFEPVRIKGKLRARNVSTNTIAPEGEIRYIQILTAEKNKQLLVVDHITGRITRINPAQANMTPKPTKKSFEDVIQSRDPKTMFDNLSHLTKMVGKGIQPSLLITGAAGVGKTHLVKKTLAELGLRESEDFVHFKGRATAAGLFITLYENSDRIVVLDDCDSVFRDDDAVNILKAALDSYDTRRISYLTSKPLKDSFDQAVPRHFEFTGRIIFISNKSRESLDEAIRSRSFVADITMTTDQLFQRLEQLMPDMERSIPMTAKQQALSIMKKLHAEYAGFEVNLRTFIKAARICAMGFDTPEMMVAEQCIGA
jgi:hypothetical protein